MMNEPSIDHFEDLFKGSDRDSGDRFRKIPERGLLAEGAMLTLECDGVIFHF